MVNSILTSTKKVLGIDESYTAFDVDITMHINSVFSTLNQLGIGPEIGFMIEDASAEWDSFLDGDLRLNDVKTYIYLRVRLLFDPPSTGYLNEAYKTQITELEWRLNIERERTQWIDPDPTSTHYPLIIDGGDDE